MKTGGASGRGFNPFGRPAAGKPYQVAIGRDFTVQEIQARTEQSTAQTRDFIAQILLSSVALAIGYAAGLGILKGNWSYLQTVWVPAGPLVGAMTAHYFRKG